ncbi:hypothetical protein BN1200_390017 [Klebsiella variicola]|nr:hypothetical protein BN1200_390017 [Klebsiella variicola]
MPLRFWCKGEQIRWQLFIIYRLSADEQYHIFRAGNYLTEKVI